MTKLAEWQLFLENSTMTSGVYIMTNKVNGCRYIGYSEDIESRWNENKRQLRAETFGKDYPQIRRDFTEFGEASFIWGILEVTTNDKNLMSKRSEEWKKLIKPEYNRSTEPK